jgi:polysaccharide export outer membrane protein
MLRGIVLSLALLPALLPACSSGADELPGYFERAPGHGPTAATDVGLLEQFAPGDDAYHLGPGDKLTVDVWGRSEISGPHIIGPDGRISVPIAGSLTCSNLTREEVEQAITKALDKYYKAVSVTVRVDEYASNRVSVLGNVETPGSYLFTDQPTLLGALSMAGGVGRDLEHPTAMSPRCSVIRGRSQIVWVDLGELLGRGNVGLNIPLQRNDVVYVPDGTGVMVYVLGEVRSPGVISLTPGLSLTAAIALAGGWTEDAKRDEVRILRPTRGATAELDYFEILTGDNFDLDAALEDGDIIYVPTRWLEHWNYFWRKINPFAGLFAVQPA